MKNKCTICEAETKIIFTAKVLNKYDVNYFKCNTCGFIETQDPFWLNEAYSNAITQLDIGLIWRNQHYAEIIERFLLEGVFEPDGIFLDYGGGYGMFVRMMRDKGFNYYRQDIYCENLFAKHFDITDLQQQIKFDFITAFEVFEHLVDPRKELEKMFHFSDIIIFSTELQPEGKLDPETWWYFAPETGQHISFYNVQSLEVLAEKIGCFFYSNKHNLHIFSKKQIVHDPFLPVIKKQTSKLSKVFGTRKPGHPKRESLLFKDFDYIKKLINSGDKNTI